MTILPRYLVPQLHLILGHMSVQHAFLQGNTYHNHHLKNRQTSIINQNSLLNIKCVVIYKCLLFVWHTFILNRHVYFDRHWSNVGNFPSWQTLRRCSRLAYFRTKERILVWCKSFYTNSLWCCSTFTDRFLQGKVTLAKNSR